MLAGMLGDAPNALLSFAWRFTATTTKRALAPAWAAGATIAPGDAVSIAGWILVTAAGGVTGSMLPIGAGTDGGVTWVAYPIAGAKYLQITNTDGGQIAYQGDANIQVMPLPFNNGSGPQTPPNPLNWYAVTPANTAVLVVGVAS
jgi:hypothetical protein